MPVYKYGLPVLFDGFTTQVTVDVSVYIQDARLGIWSLYDIDGTVIVGAVAPITATQVHVTLQPAPPAGSYRLVGIQ